MKLPDTSLNAALAELEDRVAQRVSHPCEEVLDAFPELKANSDAVLELIYTEHVLRQEAGEEQSVDVWIQRFPHLRDDLAKLIRVHELLEGNRSVELNSGEFNSTLRSSRRDTQPRLGEIGDRSHRLGDYDLLELIGRGGMGIVYRARQRKLDRIVAVKTIARDAILDPGIGRRFEAEARSAARLQHPNIVQIHEVRSQDGWPYFSMEYINGGDLTDLTSTVPLEGRHAALLLEILARAVQYAHTQGIIHRDLKPANILIHRRDSGDPLPSRLDGGMIFLNSEGGLNYEPKIADFGLAKSLSDDGLRSQHTMALGTPSYMSPEQAGEPGEPVGPACDIYGLGAVLYQALTTRPPFVAHSILETMRQVREEEPVAPRVLQPQAPSDLETICMHCLRKRASDRYPSAGALADDLRRYLDGRPILARPASVFYRFSKYARRHRTLVGGLMAVFVVLLAGIAATTWQARQALAERNFARQEERRSSATAELLARALRAATPEVAQGGEPTIRQFLDQTSEMLRTSPDTYPLVAADTHQILADAYFSLGAYPLAEDHAKRAIQLQTQLHGANSDDALSGQATLAEALSRRDQDEEAVQIAKNALEQGRKYLNSNNVTLFQLIDVYAQVLSRAPNPDNSAILALHREAFERAASALGPDHQKTLLYMSDFGVALMDAGEFDQADKVLRNVHQLRLERLGESHPETLVDAFNIAILLFRKGDYQSAAEFLRPRIERVDSVFGFDHPRAIRHQVFMAQLEFNLHNLDAAESYGRRALDRSMARLGAKHQHTFEARGILTNVMIQSGRLDEAEQLATEQCRLAEETYGAGHEETVQSIALMFDVLDARGNIEGMARCAEKLRGSPLERPALEAVKAAREKQAQTAVDPTQGPIP